MNALLYGRVCGELAVPNVGQHRLATARGGVAHGWRRSSLLPQHQRRSNRGPLGGSDARSSATALDPLRAR